MLMTVMASPATASPRTNLEAPSMAPKNSASCSRPERRLFASRSSIMPAARSASMAICLPGMASRVKRAATSETRPAPLVMTAKFTTSRMTKMTMPTTRLPPTAKRPKVSMRWPAAPGPSPPCRRMRRVVATLSARRKRVVMRSREGKTEKSSARVRPSAVRSMSSESPTENASRTSSPAAGTGTMRMTTMARTAPASTSSARAAAGPCPGSSAAMAHLIAKIRRPRPLAGPRLQRSNLCDGGHAEARSFARWVIR